MRDAMLLVCALCAGVIGLAWFALAKPPHWRQVTGEAAQGVRTRRGLRIGGALALTVSLGLCLAADHISMSFLVWIMMLVAGALSVAFVLAYRPRTLNWLTGRIPGS